MEAAMAQTATSSSTPTPTETTPPTATTTGSNTTEDTTANGTPSYGPYWDIPPPPPKLYPSFEAGRQDFYQWAKQHGVDYSLNKPRKNKDGNIYRYTVRCTRFGKLDNKRKLADHERKRARASKKTGCRMGFIYAAADPAEPTGEWEIRHQRDRTSSQHNHPPAESSQLPGHRRRERETNEPIQSMIETGLQASMTPMQTLQMIRAQNPAACITVQDIRNSRKQFKNQEQLQSLIPTATMFLPGEIPDMPPETEPAES